MTDQLPEDRETGLDEVDERVEGVPGGPPGSPETPSTGPLRGQAAEPGREDDAYLRLAADFDNYKKRVAREHAELARHANERLLNHLLPVLDDLERALQAAEEHEEAKLEEGVRLVHRALEDVLRKEGLAEIEAEGAFDPHVHEALLAQPGGEEAASGDVLQVLQKGYRLGDRVLRPARVIVAE